MSNLPDVPRIEEPPTVVEPVPDLQLQLLVRLLDQDPSSSLPITLHTPSGLLYGELIAHEAWKDSWASGLRQMEGSGAQLLARMPEAVDQTLTEMHGENAPRALPQWLHLRDVTCITGAATPVTSALWRGRLADVVGWSLGNPDQASART